MRNDRTQVIFTIHEFYAGFYIIFMIDTKHQAGLVKTLLVIAGYLDFHFKFTPISSIIKRSVIYRKPVMGNPPIVALGSDLHGKRLIFNSHCSGSLNHCILSNDCAPQNCKETTITKLSNTNFLILLLISYFDSFYSRKKLMLLTLPPQR